MSSVGQEHAEMIGERHGSMQNLVLLFQVGDEFVGMEATVEVAAVEDDSMPARDAQATAEAALKRRVAALIDTVTFTLFSYITQVRPVHLPELSREGVDDLSLSLLLCSFMTTTAKS